MRGSPRGESPAWLLLGLNLFAGLSFIAPVRFNTTELGDWHTGDVGFRAFLTEARRSVTLRACPSRGAHSNGGISLGWPGDGAQATLISVTTGRFTVGEGSVYLFGSLDGEPISLPFTQDDSDLHLTLPSPQPYTAVAYAPSEDQPEWYGARADAVALGS